MSESTSAETLKKSPLAYPVHKQTNDGQHSISHSITFAKYLVFMAEKDKSWTTKSIMVYKCK